MRVALLVLFAVMAACAPNQGTTGNGRDVPRHDVADGTADTGHACDDAACNDRCVGASYPGGSCSDTGACVCRPDSDASTPASAGERCDDGVDNNGNGAVNEGCGCDPTVTPTQACYPGPPETRHHGLCQDGTQPCIASGEFAHWGECTGFVVPAEEVCDDLDNNCNLAVDEGCGTCVPTELGGETICDDGIDNDCDGVADCFDNPDCPPCCTDEICGDGIDNNCDGTVDEFCDSPCTGFEMGPIVCHDGIDNDCDGRINCRDLQCLPFCCTPEDCSDGTDNDCDGRVNCEDPDCCTYGACSGSVLCGLVCCVPGTIRWCDTPTYCSWGQQSCRPDGLWGTCEETSNRPSGCGTDLYYYDSSCCVAASECCMNFGGYGRYDPALPDDASVGTCGGIASACP